MLIFNLKKEWFEKIKSGEKTHEYRKYDYWYPRIIKKYKKAKAEQRLLKICLKCGYPRKNDKSRIIYGEVIKISVLWGNGHKIDDNIPTPVVDIEFKLTDEGNKFDCVHRYRRILPYNPTQGMRISNTEDECFVMSKIIPSHEGCSIECKGYASRFIEVKK